MEIPPLNINIQPEAIDKNSVLTTVEWGRVRINEKRDTVLILMVSFSVVAKY